MSERIYELSENREIELWKEAIFIFDSSALLDFYLIPKHTLEKIFDELFAQKLKDKLWITSHAKYEYNKNKENTFRKAINEKYNPLRKDSLIGIQKSVSTIERKLKDLKDKTKNNDFHPHINQSEIEDYSKKFEAFKDETHIFEKKIEEEISIKEKEIDDFSKKDDIYNAINEYFKTGRYFKFDEILNITKEGKHRYDFFIPPGYKDLKDKKGTQIFGDLIIWKQVLEIALNEKKPIIFICNDKKEDWYDIKSIHRNKILKPRNELIKEIYDYADVEFWMYELPKFLRIANKQITTSIDETEINILSLSINKKANKLLKKEREGFREKEMLKRIWERIGKDKSYTKCGECDGGNGYGNFISHWEITPIINEYPEEYIDSKHEKAEIGFCDWCNTMHIECPNCFHINSIHEQDYNENFECEGGCGIIFYIESSYDHHGIEDDLTIFIKDHRVEQCQKCGDEYINVNGIDICQKCENEYAYGE